MIFGLLSFNVSWAQNAPLDLDSTKEERRNALAGSTLWQVFLKSPHDFISKLTKLSAIEINNEFETHVKNYETANRKCKELLVTRWHSEKEKMNVELKAERYMSLYSDTKTDFLALSYWCCIRSAQHIYSVKESLTDADNPTLIENVGIGWSKKYTLLSMTQFFLNHDWASYKALVFAKTTHEDTYVTLGCVQH